MATAPPAPVGEQLDALLAALGADGTEGGRGPVLPSGHDAEADAERVELLAAMERAKSALCAAQADLALALEASVREQEADDGIPARRRARGVAAQVALARRVSPHRGRVLLGLAHDLAVDLPHTRTALRTGRLDEHRALLVATESGCLDHQARQRLDAETCGPDARAEGGLLDQHGPRGLAGHVRARVAALDPAAVVRRHSRAVASRRITCSPAPDGMAWLTALLPLTDAVSVYATLRRDAATLRTTGATGDATGDATGEQRSQGAVMADLLVHRARTSTPDEAGAPTAPVALQLVMSDASLFGAGPEPATIPGHGPLPAQVARELLARAGAAGQAWVRRLYTNPAGRLVALTTPQRFATDGLATFLTARDQGTCRTPWCDAPTAHHDHAIDHAHGGPTDEPNLQGLCAACNHTKQTPRWRHQPHGPRSWPHARPDAIHTVRITTPTGHHHTSRAPAPPRPATPAPTAASTTELALELDLAA